MKIIFLDVDGVLNSYKSTGYMPLSEGAIKRLRNIILSTDAKIVVSSTWRIGNNARNKLIRHLGYKGLSVFDWTRKTKSISSEGISDIRGNQIQDWIDFNDVEAYIILDDDSDMLDCQMNNFVQINPEVGLTDRDVELGIKILMEKETK